MAGFKDFVDEQNLTEGTIKIHYEWDRPLDGSEKALSKKYGITIKVINQMHAEITGEKKKILNFLQHEDALIKSDPDMLDVLYSELVESEITERIQILPDEKIDSYIEREWGKGQAYTYEYNIHAAAELAKVFPDVLVTKDMKYMHIPGTIDMKQNAELNKIEAKYKLKDLQK